VEASTKVNSADALISTDAVQGNGSSSGSYGSQQKRANEVQPNDHLLLVPTEADKVAWMSPNACEGPNAEEQMSAVRKDFHIFDTSHDGNLNLQEIKVQKCTCISFSYTCIQTGSACLESTGSESTRKINPEFAKRSMDGCRQRCEGWDSTAAQTQARY